MGVLGHLKNVGCHACALQASCLWLDVLREKGHLAIIQASSIVYMWEHMMMMKCGDPIY